MAYSRRTSRRKTYSRAPARRTYGRSSRTSRTPRRASSRSRVGSAGRTVRIVIEQVAPNAVQRPPLGTVPAPAQRKPAFA